MKFCPKCSTIIRNPEAQFCYNCGTRLPEKKEESNTVNRPKNLKQEQKTVLKEAISTIESPQSKPINIKSKSTDKLSKKWFNFIIGANILSLSFLLISLGLFFKTTRNESTAKITPLVEINNVQIQPKIIDKNLLEGFVLSSNFYSIVPQQPLFYLERGNLQQFLPNFLDKKEIEYLEETYKTPLKELLTFTNNQFAYLKKDKNTWAVITSPASVDFFDRAFSNYQENKKEDAPLLSARIGEFLVFTNSKEYLDDFRSASDNTLLTISKDARFTTKVSKAPKNSVFFSYVFSDSFIKEGFLDELRNVGLENMYEEIKGSPLKAFVITKSKDNAFEVIILN